MPSDAGCSPPAHDGDQSHGILKKCCFPPGTEPGHTTLQTLLEGCSAVKILLRELPLQQSILTLQHRRYLRKDPRCFCVWFWAAEGSSSSFPPLLLQPRAMGAVLHTARASRLSNHMLSHLPGRGRLTNWSGRGFFIKGELFWWDNSQPVSLTALRALTGDACTQAKRCGAELWGAPR